MTRSSGNNLPGRIDTRFVDDLRVRGVIHDDEDLSVLFDRLAFIQAVSGYRFGIDAVVLARYAAQVAPEAASVLDIGTGCGVVGILLGDAIPSARVTAVELQSSMADRARRNFDLNGLAARSVVLEADISDFVSRSFDLIVSNPPFYRYGSGRINPDGERAAARHEIHLDMPRLLAAISGLLATEGTAVVLYPSERLADMLALAPRAGLSVPALVPLLSGPGLPPESYLFKLAHANDAVTPSEPVHEEPRLLTRDG